MEILLTANQGRNRTKNASNYAKEIVERSVSKIMERTREERITRSLERIQEINEHGFNNKNGTGHVTGIYRWVDKYYRLRSINYGRRLMTELEIPDPGSYLAYIESNKKIPGIKTQKPDEPSIKQGKSERALRPGDLTRNNYLTWIGKYNVKDAVPPPEVKKILSYSVAQEVEEEDPMKNGYFAKTYTDLVVPDGYEAVKIQDLVARLRHAPDIENYIPEGNRDLTFEYFKNINTPFQLSIGSKEFFIHLKKEKFAQSAEKGKDSRRKATPKPPNSHKTRARTRRRQTVSNSRESASKGKPVKKSASKGKPAKKKSKSYKGLT